jgi:uncharacterized short protein YbdD (DUF466 family)
MSQALKYMIDDKGMKTSVLVPLSQWNKLQDDYKRLQNKLQVLTGIKSALQEVNRAQKTGKKLNTLKEFIDECKG